MADRGCVRGSTLASAADILRQAAWGPAGGTGTAIVCDIVVAAGSFLGERVRVVTGSPTAVASDVSTVLYTDLTTGEVVTADQLWTQDARRHSGTISSRPCGARRAR